MKSTTVLILVLLTIGPVLAQDDVLGKWKTIDDNSQETKSVVEIAERDGKLFGKVIMIFPKPGKDPDPVCNKCDATDHRYKNKIIGMEIIRNLQKDGSAYSGGDILDPENGKVYRSKIWVEGRELKVRGYWGPFYRTQTWLRAN